MVLSRRSRTRVKKVSEPIDQKVFIGTLGVNCLEYTRRCIETLQSNCREVKFLYIDNGSSVENCDQISSWNSKNPDIDEFNVGFNGYNAGVGPGWNQLINAGLDWGADKILICNNDIAFGPHTVDGMVQAYDRLREHVPETVMVTATNHTKNPNELKSIKQEWNYHEHPDFSCYMVTKETIDRVGYLSEEFKPGFFEDNEYHWRILLMGYKAFGTDWAPYSHIASRTRDGNPGLVDHQTFRRNKIQFFREMMTDDVEQEIAVARYQRYMEHLANQQGGGELDPHPDYRDVLDWCSKEPDIITPQLLSWLEGLHIGNLPQGPRATNPVDKAKRK